MSWFVEISEKAENLLNTIDKNAAIALNKQKTGKTNNSSERFNAAELENSGKISIENIAVSIPKQNNDVYLSFNEESITPRIADETEQDASYQRSITPVIKENINDQFQTEMLQNEIHSLNNEISLLLNRAKIAEQKSIHLSEKLASVELRNVLLEEQISKLTMNGHLNGSMSVSTSSNDSSLIEGTKKNSKDEWHEHYEAQIQELMQEKSNLEEEVKSKTDEILMLKSRLNQQSYSFSSEDLNSRLRALTITLVQKQSSLERLTSEKNSLEAKYDQLHRKYEEAVNRLHQRVSLNDTDDVKAQIPIFQTDTPGIRHRLRNAYSLFNPATNIEFLFKKSSIIRTFVWIYMILMHCLVFLLLNSHMPETTNV